MKFNRKLGRCLTCVMFVLFAVAALASTGCTVYTNGMTLPNPYYHKNRPQYFPRGTEFPFPNEASNLQETEQEIHQSHGH